MAKKPAKKPHKQRPKGPGNEEPPAKRVRKQAAKPTDLAASIDVEIVQKLANKLVTNY